MANSLLSIKPHKVSRDLKGYSVFFYGDPKSGKTTIASKFPDALLLAFEKGYNAIPGIMVKPLNTWSEFKKTLRELKDPEVKEQFKTVIIDTADIAYMLCEKWVCQQESNEKVDYTTIGDIPYGKGYKLAEKEFDEALRAIIQMDYGLVIISHSIDKTFTDENNKDFNQIVPTLDNRARKICERTCDIIGYARSIQTDEGKRSTLYLRQTSRFVAGSRFKYMPNAIDFTYENLVNAIQDAIDKEAKEFSGTLVTDESVNTQKAVNEYEYDFDALKAEFQTIVGDLMSTGSPTMGSKIQKIIEAHLGKGKKAVDCTPDQAAELDLIVYDLKQL
jgi:hypothetical protein